MWAVLSASKRRERRRDRESGNVHSSWFIPFKACDVVNALPHASWVIVVEMFFNFVFVLLFGCFDGSPDIITGLFPIVSVSGFKGRCPMSNLMRSRRAPHHFQVHTQAATVSSESEPMQIGFTHLTHEDRERSIRNHLCLYCGLSSHLRASCPTRPAA